MLAGAKGKRNALQGAKVRAQKRGTGGGPGVKPRDGWARERNIFPGGTRITVETRKIMKLVLKSVKVNII